MMGEFQLMAVVDQHHPATLTEHDVEIQLSAQPLVAAQGKFVQRCALRIEIVGTHIRCVAPSVATTDPTALQNRDSANAKFLGEIIGSG
jgi:hypothetical protein